jgi:hypothetical protein
MWIIRYGLWIFVLGFTAVLLLIGHRGVRSSQYYADAVDRLLAENPELDRSDISLCVFCSYRIKRRGWATDYDFTLVIDRGETSEKVRIRGREPPR